MKSVWDLSLHGKNDELQKLITDFPGVVSSVDLQFGQTALHRAVYFGQKGTVELLISKNADPNAKDLDGNTPLHIACKEGQKDVARYLLSLDDVDIDAKNKLNETILHKACGGTKYTWKETCFEIVVMLLENNASLTEKDYRGKLAKDNLASLTFAYRFEDELQRIITSDPPKIVKLKRNDLIIKVKEEDKGEDEEKESSPLLSSGNLNKTDCSIVSASNTSQKNERKETKSPGCSSSNIGEITELYVTSPNSKGSQEDVMTYTNSPFAMSSRTSGNNAPVNDRDVMTYTDTPYTLKSVNPKTVNINSGVIQDGVMEEKEENVFIEEEDDDGDDETPSVTGSRKFCDTERGAQFAKLGENFLSRSASGGRGGVIRATGRGRGSGDRRRDSLSITANIGDDTIDSESHTSDIASTLPATAVSSSPSKPPISPISKVVVGSTVIKPPVSEYQPFKFASHYLA